MLPQLNPALAGCLTEPGERVARPIHKAGILKILDGLSETFVGSDLEIMLPHVDVVAVDALQRPLKPANP